MTGLAATSLKSGFKEEPTIFYPVHSPGYAATAGSEPGSRKLRRVGRPNEALVEFDKSLEQAPKRFNSLYGAAQAAAACDKAERARAYFAALVAAGAGADSERPELLVALRAVKER